MSEQTRIMDEIERLEKNIKFIRHSYSDDNKSAMMEIDYRNRKIAILRRKHFNIRMIGR